MMFGYATDEMTALAGAGDEGTPESTLFMPAPIMLANRLVERLSQLRGDGVIPWLRPDGKAQVTVEYEDDEPRRVTAIVLSTQHAPEVTLREIREEVIEQVIRPVMPEELFDPDSCLLHINPTGRFVIGGPHGDTGLTGRKIMVDTYGGAARHGGGAFSGKDPSKVDRSGAYGARWAAKNIVAAGLARRCEISVAYAIGVPEPVAIQVETFGTSDISEEVLGQVVRELFDFRPRPLCGELGLTAPIYSPTAVYGHFGREPYTARVGGEEHRFFTWEELDRLDELRGAIGARG
jgi:S-adenosylmethionine synthetase